MSTETNINNWLSPFSPVCGRRLALVVTGGVAAYKAAELARMWVRSGALVRVIMTENATRFITPLSFESLTGQKVAVSMWDKAQFDIEHISLANWAESVVAAPATANFIAKMANGLADDLASTFMLAFNGPKVVAPAMNSRMLAAAPTLDNLRRLKQWGTLVVNSQGGLLACGEHGDGRLAALESIALSAVKTLCPQDLAGRRISISAGSTRESWDDIRFLANRSTGQMGLALAQAAWLRGAEVTLIAGPSVVLPPYGLPGLNIKRIESTVDLLNTVRENDDFDALIMAAAPADFRPAQKVGGKIKKGGQIPQLTLAQNPDILKSLKRRDSALYIGFAAESSAIINSGRKKLADKNLDMIVANQAGGPSTAFGAADNHLWLIFPDGHVKEISQRPKFAAAWSILDAAAPLMKKNV